ncbi:hypothetical protein ACEPPU_24320 [Priestia aryabhattai]|uniref:hypothetical protein n=1 Tax=Priestia aryabhattai TaxID=412384 RepID=UPI0035AC1E92
MSVVDINEGVKRVYDFLKENEHRSFEIQSFIDEGETLATIVEKPTSIICDYVNETIGHALAIHFENASIEFTEQNFEFQKALTSIGGVPYGFTVIINHKKNTDFYYWIDFR